MKAVHFGAGNIGRGFVGLLLHEGGYDLVFSDVAAPLVAAINAASEYTVHEVGEGGTDKTAPHEEFWGYWGTCKDRFGIRWMFNVMNNQ